MGFQPDFGVCDGPFCIDWHCKLALGRYSAVVPDSECKGERVLRGIAVSDGVSRGKVLVLARPGLDIPKRDVPENDLGREIERFRAALNVTRRQIHEIHQQVTTRFHGGETAIFEAHLLVLDDPMLLEEVFKFVNEHRVNVEYAFHVVSEKFAAEFAAMPDDYLRERASDIRDVAGRVLNNLLGRHAELDLKQLKEQFIIISHDLTPSTTAQLDKTKVLGFATEIGGKTSHTAIMARSLSIPAVVGLRNVTLELQTGDQVLLDGFNGVIVVNPTDQTLFPVRPTDAPPSGH
jgi:phosphotransferase system enzyme I (PtsI)